MIIKGKGFVLRDYRRGDEISIQRNINSKDVYRYTIRIPHPYTMEHAKKWVKGYLKSKNKRKKDYYKFAIDIKGEVVGGISLENIEKHKCELGYWLGKKYWNKGIMTQVVGIIANFGFKKLKLARIYATTDPKNKASQMVLKKNGFKLEGFLKKDHLKDKKFRDSYLFAKIK